MNITKAPADMLDKLLIAFILQNFMYYTYSLCLSYFFRTGFSAYSFRYRKV